MFLLAIPWEPALLTDVGVYYPIGPAFRGAELLIISEAQPQPRRGGRVAGVALGGICHQADTGPPGQPAASALPSRGPGTFWSSPCGVSGL